MMLAVVQRLTCHGTPVDLWRTTNASTPIAAIVSIVSRRLSPLFTLDVLTLKSSMSADRRLAAVSKDSRVRVESSKNRLHTVLPRSAGTFGLGRWLISAIVSVSSSRRRIAVRPELGDRPQVLHRSPPSDQISTPSALTRTSSPALVGRFLPTKSGRIGSSR